MATARMPRRLAVDLKPISEAVAQAFDQVAQPPGSLVELNETETRALLIDPVLHGLGYVTLDQMRREYRLQSGQKVDYFLRAGDRRVVVEAKASNTDLTIQDASQLVGYCAQEGVRWALLTNGLHWEVFDIEAPGNTQAKRVAEIDLLTAYRNGAIEKELEPLAHFGREVLSQDDRPLSQWAQRERTGAYLNRLITDPTSSVVKAAVDELRRASIVVEPADVVTLLRGPGTERRITSSPAAPATPQTVAPGKAAPLVSPPSVSFYLFPAGRSEGFTSLDHLHHWLGAGFWGLHASTRHRTRVKRQDRCCFYATGVGVVATAVVTAPADQSVQKHEWPGSDEWHEGVYKLPLTDIEWIQSPVEITADLRQRLDAFRDKDPRRSWSWLVQTTAKPTERDFGLLTRHVQ